MPSILKIEQHVGEGFIELLNRFPFVRGDGLPALLQQIRQLRGIFLVNGGEHPFRPFAQQLGPVDQFLLIQVLLPFAPPAAQPMPQELTDRLAADAVLRTAFESLTPGRRRAYALYLGQAKQSATRLARLERCVPLILEGLGPNERG